MWRPQGETNVLPRRPSNGNITTSLKANDLPRQLTKLLYLGCEYQKEETGKSRKELLESIKMPRSHKTTAQYINSVSHTRVEVQKGLDVAAAQERHYVQQAGRDHDDDGSSLAPPSISSHGWCGECGVHHIPHTRGKRFTFVGYPKREPVVLPVMIIGDKRIGVGSRIGGHARRGGGTMRRSHRRLAAVGMHDEFKTSKVCAFCWRPTALAGARRVKNGQVQTLRVSGSIECVNPQCVSFRASYTVKAQDRTLPWPFYCLARRSWSLFQARSLRSRERAPTTPEPPWYLHCHAHPRGCKRGPSHEVYHPTNNDRSIYLDTGREASIETTTIRGIECDGCLCVTVKLAPGQRFALSQAIADAVVNQGSVATEPMAVHAETFTLAHVDRFALVQAVGEAIVNQGSVATEPMAVHAETFTLAHVDRFALV
ncbi:hypothetical protein KVV02_008379 [Mortierella alpina]|uniref:Uncharacterized protein n=1 Tax=Mortierella alpina TaxID=64518 RepID=A0A9P8A0I6_MORAP|nr:hypothetical protein KVV02_008379 [Mortierella alpina]